MRAADEKPRKNGEYPETLARGLSVLRSFTKERPEGYSVLPELGNAFCSQVSIETGRSASTAAC